MDLQVDVLREANLRAINSLRYLFSLRPGQTEEVTGMSLAEVIASPATTVYMVRDGGQEIGALTLVVVQLPSGLKAWIEDLVIDDAESWRREMAAEALLSAAIQACRQAMVSMLQITPNVPLDAAAERVCARLGFETARGVMYALATG